MQEASATTMRAIHERAAEILDRVVRQPSTVSVKDVIDIYRISSDNTLEAVTVQHLGQRPGITNTEILVRSPDIQDGDQILISRLPAAVTGLKVEIIQ